MSSFFTRHSLSPSSLSNWVGTPAASSFCMMKALNLLFTMPLRSSCSMRLPSNAEVSLRNSRIKRSASSVLKTDLALPR
jgi:hypothetical protein